MCVHLIAQLLWLVGRLSALKPVYHISGVAVVTPTDLPKSVRSRCVIKIFLWRSLCCHDDLGFFCGYRGFCHMA